MGGRKKKKMERNHKNRKEVVEEQKEKIEEQKMNLKSRLVAFDPNFTWKWEKALKAEKKGESLSLAKKKSKKMGKERKKLADFSFDYETEAGRIKLKRGRLRTKPK